jgi:long-chain acyl-CoA synthetase
MQTSDIVLAIQPEQAITLPGLFSKRVELNPDKEAFSFYNKQSQQWQSYNWFEASQEVARWQALIKSYALKAQDKIAIMISNSPQWVFVEQAALALENVVVPLYMNDCADNIAYIIDDADIKLLFLESDKVYQELAQLDPKFPKLKAIIILEELSEQTRVSAKNSQLTSPLSASAILPKTGIYQNFSSNAQSLASIVYTSGTTGNPKGVMLSHHSILQNAWSAHLAVPCLSEDVFLSFLPLSHMFERTVGYYIPMMMGAKIVYARSVQYLAEDLLNIKPTVLVTVPLIFERIHKKIMAKLQQRSILIQWLFQLTNTIGWSRFLYQQKRKSWFLNLILWPILNHLVVQKVQQKLGGNLRLAISGGAPLAENIALFFTALGVTITQGYGMTETAPVISTNRLDNNDPFSVGNILSGIKVKIDTNGELLVKSPSAMMGYWKQPEATQEIFEKDGWLHTGDIAKIKDQHLYISGRIKEILVLSNGEKVPPAELESSICNDPIFEQALVIGEAHSFLSAIVVINKEQLGEIIKKIGLKPFNITANMLKNMNSTAIHQFVLERLKQLLHRFPKYAQIKKIRLEVTPWTIDNGFLTPTMKLKRNVLQEHYKQMIEHLYRHKK